MFRHQTHPYQTTVVPRSDAQFRHSTQQRLKYPWLENPPPRDCQSTNSSNSDSYQAAHYSEAQDRWGARSRSDGLSSPVYHMPYPENARRSPPSMEYPNRFTVIDVPNYNAPICTQESDGSARDRGGGPTLPPARSPVPSEIRVSGGCGGHCPGFEYVCYYVLQIIFVIGILTGISLCIAGSVLRRSNRVGDLGVLVYIGCLAAMVCSVLLGVQCCVRRKNKQRCKQLRLRTAPPDCIPLDTIPSMYIGEHNTMPNQIQNPPQRHLQPLLHPVVPKIVTSLPRSHHRSDPRDDNSSPCEEINGVPWWRR